MMNDINYYYSSQYAYERYVQQRSLQSGPVVYGEDAVWLTT